MATVSRGRIPKDKSVGAALVLTFFLGPFGLFYSVVWWAVLLMLLGATVAGIFSLGFGLIPFWAISMVWGAIAASNKHSRYLAWLAMQPQLTVTRRNVDEPAPQLTPPPPPPPATMAAPATNPSSVSGRSAQEEEALRELKRLHELGLISEAEAASRRAEIIERIFGAGQRHPGSADTGEAPSSADASPSPDERGADEAPAAPAEAAPLDERPPAAGLPPEETTLAMADAPDAVTEPLAAMACEERPLGEGAVTSVSPQTFTRRSALRSPWLVVAVAAVCAAAVALAVVLVRDERGHRAGTPAAAGRPSTPASASATVEYPLVSVTLSVHVLHSQQGVPSPSPLYPTPATFSVPRPWAREVTAYGVVGGVFLAPAGWRASDALIAVDGSAGVTLRAAGSSSVPGRLVYEDSGGGAGNAWYDSAPYFPWVRAHWSQSGLGGTPPPSPSGLSEDFPSTGVATYTITSGPDVTDGLQINGVAGTTLTSGDLAMSGYGFDGLQVALPARDQPLAAAILRYYRSPMMDANRGVSLTLQSYFDDVDAKDFQSAWQLFSPGFQATTTASAWAAGMSTVHDADVVIHHITLANARTALAYVTFTSTQAPGQGPGGDTQDHWTLDYKMQRIGEQWLIDYVGPYGGSTHTAA